MNSENKINETFKKHLKLLHEHLGVKENDSSPNIENKAQQVFDAIKSKLGGKSANEQQLFDNFLAWQLFTPEGQDFFKKSDARNISPEIIRAKADALAQKNDSSTQYFKAVMDASLKKDILNKAMERFALRAHSRMRKDNRDWLDTKGYEGEKERKDRQSDKMPNQFVNMGDDGKPITSKTGNLSPIALAKKGLDAKGNPLPQDVINQIVNSSKNDDASYWKNKFSQIYKNSTEREKSDSDDMEKNYDYLANLAK
jgi:hypothetical protein